MGLRTMLVKHLKTGVYQFRKRIPKELVAIFGRNEIKKSLSTKNPAEAKLFVLKAESDFNDLMEAQRLNLQVPQEERYKAIKDLQQCGLVSLDTTDITLELINSLYCTVHDYCNHYNYQIHLRCLNHQTPMQALEKFLGRNLTDPDT